MPTGRMLHKYKKLRGRAGNVKPTLLRKHSDDEGESEKGAWQLAELEVRSCVPKFKVSSEGILCTEVQGVSCYCTPFLWRLSHQRSTQETESEPSRSGA